MRSLVGGEVDALRETGINITDRCVLSHFLAQKLAMTCPSRYT